MVKLYQRPFIFKTCTQGGYLIVIPRNEITARICKLQQAMQQKNIAGSIIIQRVDLYYFSGTGQNAHLVIPVSGTPILFVKKSLARAQQESPLAQIVPFEDWEGLKKQVKSLTPPGSQIGFELDVVPVKLFERYQNLLADYKLVDISGEIRKIRAVKSPFELQQLQESALVSNMIFDHAAAVIKPGMTEVELAGHLEFFARTHGHQGAVRMRGFNQELYYGHIMAGENSAAISFFDGPTGGSGLNPSYPQGAGLARLKEHEPILIDFVTAVKGYMVDQTRIFSIGEPPLHLRKAFEKAVEIKNALAKMGKPEVTGSLLYLHAEKMARNSGLANHFMGYTEKVSFIGHGVGLELDELPVIAKGLDFPLVEGMVFALEPKFIFPGEGTVGIEDTFVVEANGLKQLTLTSDQFTIV